MNLTNSIVPVQTRNRRGLKPRPRPPSADASHLVEKLSAPGQYRVYPPQQELLDSPLWGLLFDADHSINGTWIPTWLLEAVRHEGRARILAELLWWFELAFNDLRKIERQPKRDFVRRMRARVYDKLGVQWLAISTRMLAARTMVAQRSVVDILNWLFNEKLIFIDDESGKSFWVRPDAENLARAYYTRTNDEVAFIEFLDEGNSGRRVEWAGSRTQEHACHDRIGVTVHNAFVLALRMSRGDGFDATPGIFRRSRRDLFLARLLSQIIFYFGDRYGRCRATLSFGGNLWWGCSYASWARNLGVSEKSVERGLQELTKLGYVRRINRFYRKGGDVEPYYTTHIRPDVDVLLAAVREVEQRNQEYTPGDENED